VFDPKKPVPKLGRQFRDGFHVEFGDGAVFFLGKKRSTEFLRPRQNGNELDRVRQVRDVCPVSSIRPFIRSSISII
jgi:hypothetical protein